MVLVIRNNTMVFVREISYAIYHYPKRYNQDEG